MRSKLPKVLHEVGGTSIIERTVKAFSKVKECAKPIVVVGDGEQLVRSVLGESCRYAQADTTGTAKAVEAALPQVQEDSVLIVNGDHPFLQAKSIKKIIAAHHESGALVMGIVHIEDFSGWREGFTYFGRVVRMNGRVARVVEYKNATEEEKNIKELNINVLCARTQWLANVLPTITPNPITGEYHITDIVAVAAEQIVPVVTLRLLPEEGFGINTPQEHAEAQRIALQMS